jgi:hypothetical protein
VRWIRLDVEFDKKRWVFAMSEGSQLAWVKLKCWTKAHGVKGRTAALDPLVASRVWGVGEESVVKMLAAAKDAEELAIEGTEWVLILWPDEQEIDPTATERKQRERERHAMSRVTTVTDRDSCHATETETGSKEKKPTVSKRKPDLAECQAYFSELGIPSEASAFLDHHTALDWVYGKNRTPIKDWQAAARTWKRNHEKYNPTPSLKARTREDLEACR